LQQDSKYLNQNKLNSPTGEPGSKGGPGAPAPTILTWKIDRESYTATPIMSDASEVPAIEMRALFEQFHDERG
jgi:hypothetical protein